jgi:hypothetical protein
VLALAGGVSLVTCKAEYAGQANTSPGLRLPGAEIPTAAHQVRVYVNAINCEMNAEDARRLNAIGRTAGLDVEVVFAGIAAGDTAVLERAKTDLGLNVKVRLLKDRELEPYKPIGGARMPMALVIKANQLKTILAGESMPRTLSLLEASMSPTAGQ